MHTLAKKQTVLCHGRYILLQAAKSIREGILMAIRVIEIHHPALRIDGSEANLQDNLDFYEGLLGLSPDGRRPNIPGVPGYWINVGDVGQIHLIGGEQPSFLAKSPEKDPTSPHVALAVADVAEARAELERRGTPFWTVNGIAGPSAEQLFMHDPNGNIIELHQINQCRCKAANRLS
jgi:catechol 2,3-dioxygenase-like lactoylglutathione lyase family enzyme